MSLENAINELCINIRSINSTLLKIFESKSISSEIKLSGNIDKSSSEYTTETVIKSSPEATVDEVRKHLNALVKLKGKETAVKLLATFHNAKNLDDITPYEYMEVINKAKSILEAS